jgi:hypothetical protein
VAVERSKKGGRSVTLEIKFWWNAKDRNIHIRGEGSPANLISTVSPNPQSKRGNPNLFWQLSDCLRTAEAPFPPPMVPPEVVRKGKVRRSTTNERAERMAEVLAEAKALAREYRTLTGKPLGVVGEVAEYEAARILNLQLRPARSVGYDAVRQSDGRRFEIKARCLAPGHSGSQRVGRIRIEGEFDAVLLVLLDENLDAQEIYEATREAVVSALSAPGSKARNVRGALGVSKFKQIGHRIWKRD